MSNSDLRLISIVRLLCKQAQLLYEELAQTLSDQQSKNVLRKLARHRIETLRAISNDAAPDLSLEHGSTEVPEAILQANEVAKMRMRDSEADEAISVLVEGGKQEVSFLRQEVRNINNYALRRRLSSFVAVLQVDFDQLQMLSRNRHHQ
ncbi:MAG: hypothetical protein ACSHXZ_11225 [Gammaproteobacteria bacterium]